MMAQERIRILVDRSRDSGWADELVDTEPDDIYQVTDNRDYLSWSVLKNYDVLVICGYSPLKYKDKELEIIRKFVDIGGGLLLASSVSRFEQDIGRNISELSVNAVARLFGAEFLPLDRCEGKIKEDDNLLRGYPKEDLRLIYHAALAELEMDYIPVSNCGIIAIPENAEVFLEHSITNEPIGACLKYGKGRILIINDLIFSRDSRLTCRAFVDWLACNRVSKNEGADEIPDEIPVEEHVKEDGKIRIYYTDFVKDRVDTCLKFARKIDRELVEKSLGGSNPLWEIELSTSCSERRFEWRSPLTRAGAFMSDPRLAYSIGTKVISLVNIERRLGDLIWDAGFDYDILSKCLGIMAMRMTGFEAEADEVYTKIARQFREKDPSRREFDITRAYEYHPKLVWVLNDLIEKYGQNVLTYLVKAMPDKTDPWKNMPGSVFSSLDIFIYYLSLGLETDLYPWFKEIGTTIHPLPLHPSDSEEFKSVVRQYVDSILRDKAASASDTLEAIWCLIDMLDKEGKPDSLSTAEDSKYESIVAAMRLSRICDSRALKILEELSADEEDRALAAIAALALIISGRVSAGDRLVETARGQDCRFQLYAGYALHRLGHPKAERLSFRGMKDEKGDPAVEIKIDHDGYLLMLFTAVERHKVARIYTAPDVIHHFPGNTHVNGAYVLWVNTEPLYRRRGLSRLAMHETMAHPSLHQCSCAYLHTGTRNIAHAMYKSFGFVDIGFGESFEKELQEEIAKTIEGLIIRNYSPGDEVKMANLANECNSALLGQKRIRARRRRMSGVYIKIAEKDGEMMGYVQASSDSRSREEAHLSEIYVKKMDNRHDIGAAMLSALHNDLAAHGFKKISMDRGDLMEQEYLRKLLYSFGYTSSRTGGVYMFKIINLPMLLEELSPLLSRRLRNSKYKDWNGKIGIIGQQHKAAILVSNSRINVSEGRTEGANILITGNDETITRIIAGRITSFEAYLQIELSIHPTVNDSVTGLLETLFPRIPENWE